MKDHCRKKAANHRTVIDCTLKTVRNRKKKAGELREWLESADEARRVRPRTISRAVHTLTESF